MNTPENSTSWREVSDQLSTEQLAAVASTARRGPDHVISDPDALALGLARIYASDNLAVAMIGDVAAPPHSVNVSEWQEADSPHVFRSFDVRSWEISDGVAVDVRGVQYPDGRAEHQIRVFVDAVTADSARQLAAALLAAADEIDQLDERDRRASSAGASSPGM